MPLVPAKCTMCGAVLNIDPTKETAVCQSCGNAFVVENAINNYNTYNNNSVVNNITSDNVVVHIESEKERLNTSAETYIKLGDVRKALAAYRELVDRFPDDWRGWWGSIFYHYGYEDLHGLLRFAEREELEQKMSLFKKIAPPDEYEKLDEVVKKRLDEVRVILEKEKAEKVRALKEFVDNAIIADTQHIEYVTMRLSDARQNYDKARYELAQAVKNRETLEAEHEKYKSRQDVIERLPVLGVLGTVIFGVLGLVEGVQFGGVLIGCVVIGAVAYGVLSVVGLIISTLLPGASLTKELQDATGKESGIRRSADDLGLVISNLKSELKQCEIIRNYMENNKDFIVDSMIASGRNDILVFVNEQIG